MEVKNEKKVLALSFLGVITFIAVVVGATYAYFQAQTGGTGNIDVNANTATTDNLAFQVGSAISLTANQEDFGSSMGNKTGSTTASATLTANNATNNATRNYYVYLDIESNDFEYTTEDNQAELLLKVTDPTIADNYEITSTGTVTQEWQVEVIFANLDSDQNANAGKSFSANLIIQEEPMLTSLGNFAEYITQTLYTGTDGENDLYYHDADLANGAQDNSYRYSGSNPNNYVCFGATGADCQNPENQYRITGVFDNQVKLIKATSYGDYEWSTALNTWDESTKPDIEHTWQVGGMANTGTAKEIYDEEVGTEQSGYEETMKIGLMYASDYGYGASPEKWITALIEDNYGTDNWLYLGDDEWLISRYTGSGDFAFFVFSSNGGSMNLGFVDGTDAVRPSFYLASTATISSGTGTSTDPFVLNLG